MNTSNIKIALREIINHLFSETSIVHEQKRLNPKYAANNVYA